MRRLIPLIASMALAACSGSEHEDLRQWMQQASKDLKGRIPPLPEVKPYEPVPYDAANLLEPFKPGKIESDQKKGAGGGVQPDFNRRKEALESFPLESMNYVGIIVKARVPYAIVKADSALHQIRVGNYLGQNFGVITKISETEITLRELVPDPGGDWVERVSALQLQQKESKQ